MNTHPEHRNSLSGRRIIYYTDARSFGGHEIASLHALQWILTEGAHVDCFFQPSNQRLEAQLETLKDNYPELILHPSSPPSIRFHYIYHFFWPYTIRRMSEKFSALQPDLVFASQGNLGISALAVLAARRANLRCISYIPMAHSFRKMHSKYGRLRDWSNNYIVRIPDRWLTCTIEQIQKLRDQGAQQPIDILPNCIDLPQMATPSEARGRLSLKIGDLVIGMVGRLNNVQKGCDLFIETLNAAPKGSPLREAKLLFIGEGVDWGITRRQLEQNGWRGRILHLEWTGVPAEYLAAFDLLVMPSHFEGLPLSMQEAVLCNVPVAASAVDGLASFLPKNWLCAPNNSHALLGLLENFIQDPDEYRKALPALQQKIRNEHSTDAFHAALKKNFAATLHKM